MTRSPKVYLAGFDVFLPDAETVFSRLRAEALRLGLTALVPTDNELEVGRDGTPAQVAAKIREANLSMIREADAVIANLAPFRGLEPDAGTVYEVGFAQALGLPVCAYGLPAVPYAARVSAVSRCARDASGILREVDSGLMVEDFGLPLNLMIACGVLTAADAVSALVVVADLFRD